MGKFMEYVKMAIQNILSNKGRSFLTMLGIIIGIASVIMIMAVGAGTTAQMNSELDDIAGGLINVYTSDDALEFITADDVQEIKEKVGGVEGIAVSNYLSGETVTGKGDFTVDLNGTNEDGQITTSLDMKYGRYLSEADILEGRNVCVIADNDAKRLYGSDDVTGMVLDVTIGGVSKSFEIIGITAQKENTSFISYTYDGMPVYLDIPYSAMADFMEDYDEFYAMYVKVDKNLDSEVISQKITDLLDNRHQSAGEDYYRIQNFQDYMAQVNSVMGIMTAFVSCVAAISLLVGGIGVMNIMLVSVTERTREIGIRKSLGAKTTSIMMQFLAESAILTVLGGIIGIILGLLGAYGICSLISGLMQSQIAPVIQLSTILIATLFSCAVGVFFGIYPARKAAKLSPIEALRRN